MVEDVGLVITCPDGERVLVTRVSMDEKGGKIVAAHQWLNQVWHVCDACDV